MAQVPTPQPRTTGIAEIAPADARGRRLEWFGAILTFILKHGVLCPSSVKGVFITCV
ncbi:hypothetical protein BMETH_1613_1 [methanotrophic bacterial endosymbiont of Bathymodiolus sp.]|nr:hypothetical protein BMETH_1613_1 [methanotrophic bacterial endosymbiont of Bathymodiolus sp.]